MKTFAKLLLIGVLTTVCRVIGQLLIPGGASPALEPSIFAEKGILPNVFMVYGIVAYGIIAALYLLIEKNLTGHGIIKGLKYGASCCAVWIVYLLEPLPHVSPMDKITYPLADGAALLVLGLLLGLLLTSDGPQPENKPFKTRSWRDYFAVASCFIGGRLTLYFAFDIYSSFKTHDLQTLLWTLLTGILLSIVVIWYNKHSAGQGKLKRALLSGLLLFGADLLLFNFFMPLVFKTDIADLLLRTGVDVLAATVGLLLLPVPARSKIPLGTVIR